MTAESNEDKLNQQDDCVIHTHPLPHERLAQYSPVCDPDSEVDIANYVSGQAPDEIIRHVEKIKTEYVLAEPYEIWEVVTDKDRWWVITNMTNLYSQKHFPSLDYTLSFHIGLMMRLQSRPNGANSEEPHPFDEVFRRQEQAKDRYDRAIEAEDYQSVGMMLRECLISLISVFRRRVDISSDVEKPQDANFISWSEVLMDRLCGGGSNQQLRQYLKKTAKETWQLVNWLTHHRNASKVAASISIHSCDTIVGHFVQLLELERIDKLEKCPRCSSRHIRSHFDISIKPDGDYYATCGACGWSNHPPEEAISS